MVTVYLKDGSSFQTTGAEMASYPSDASLTAICNASGGVLAVFATVDLKYAVFS